LEFGFEALPIAVSVLLLDLFLDFSDGCFAHADPIDRAALSPHHALGHSSLRAAGSPLVTKH
jgi:hypothetical protein